MKDFNVLSYVGRSLWAITEDKWAEMVPALIRHAKGTKLTESELQAFMGGKEESEPAKPTKRGGGVAVIPIRGVIAHRMDALSASSGGCSCEAVTAMIDQVAQDESIGTIVYDIDTPGGTVAGVPELAAKMFALRGVKKQIGQVTGLCCSGGYYLASQCDEIHATESSEIGDIGVFAAHKDLSEALAKEGIKITLVKEGRHKAELSPFLPLSDEAHENLKERVAAAYGDFVKAVARGRGVEASAVRGGFGEGRSVVAKEAKALGMIDKIGSMDALLGKLTGRSSGSRLRAESEDAERELTAAEAAEALSNEMRQRLERF